eukprot:5666432-Karenia_brevis.AAC.1
MRLHETYEAVVRRQDPYSLVASRYEGRKACEGSFKRALTGRGGGAASGPSQLISCGSVWRLQSAPKRRHAIVTQADHLQVRIGTEKKKNAGGYTNDPWQAYAVTRQSSTKAK